MSLFIYFSIGETYCTLSSDYVLLHPSRLAIFSMPTQYRSHHVNVICDGSRYQMLLLRLLVAVLVGYGLYAFARYRFPDCLLLWTHFIFFAPDQTATRFVVDYLAVMGLFACAAHYGGMGLRRFSGRKKGT